LVCKKKKIPRIHRALVKTTNSIRWHFQPTFPVQVTSTASARLSVGAIFSNLDELQDRVLLTAMTIRDYISKHGLELWQRWPSNDVFGGWVPSFLVDSCESGKHPSDQFEIYSDKDCTHFVSINVTQGLFRIAHREMVVMLSEWSPIGLNYEVEPGLPIAFLCAIRR